MLKMKISNTMNALGLILCTMKAASITTIAWGWCVAPFAMAIVGSILGGILISKVINKTVKEITNIINKDS